MLETLDSEYVKLARIKGISERSVIWKHCFRNAAITPLTYFGIILANTLTGSVTTEAVFNWPGTGLLAFQAVLSRDVQLIQALVLVFAAIFVFLTLLVDVLYAYFGPQNSIHLVLMDSHTIRERMGLSSYVDSSIR